MYFPRFVFPWALVLLALVPWSIYVGARIRSLSGARRWTAVTLRTLILMCLIAALAGMEIVKRSDKLAVFFVIDHSNSVPGAVFESTVEAVQEAAREYMTPRDEAGVLVFGEESSVELAVGPNLEMGPVQSYVGGEQTDLAGAVRLAMAAFPQGRMKRIVVYSDGNETRGSALEEAKLAGASGVAVDVVPLSIAGGNEVRLRAVSTPGRANSGEPFQVRVVAHSDQDTEGMLRLYQRTAQGRQLLAEQQVTLQKGDNSFMVPQELSSPGFYEYVATLESNSDTVLANNEGQSFTIVQGEPRVLYVESDPEHSTFLAPALRGQGVLVDMIGLGDIPASLSGFQSYDAVVLSDVSATDLSSVQLSAIEALVRDLGVGLVMIGGPNTFGAGGYQNTPVEKALPIDMDIKQRKVLPRGALALVLHTCEIADGNAWARDIGLASLNVLSSQDYMGALLYGMQGESWLYEMQPVGDKTMMANALRSANPGDMPDVGTTLGMAYRGVRAVNAAVKRIVIISDGDPAPPARALLSALANDKISVSTICISPHSSNDEAMLEWVAKETGGNYYYVSDPNKLPQIFTKEASIVKRGILMEEEFAPKRYQTSELLTGLADNGMPTLLGYVVTSPKANATVPIVSHEKDPILAHWRYGLGKSVAFTSDVTSRWAANWATWNEFSRFWAQVVRWSMREVSPSSFRVDTWVEDGRGRVRIDAVDDQGKFVNFLRPKGVVTGPPPDFRTRDLPLLQTAPGIYEASFPVSEQGVYMLNMTYDRGDGSQGMIPGGMALGYSREYEYNTTNVGFLEQLAGVGNGKVRAPMENVFEHNLPVASTVTPIWLYLVAIAACLFPFEIFVRRVIFDPLVALQPVFAALRRVPLARRWAPKARRTTSATTGRYGTAPAQERVYRPTSAPVEDLAVAGSVTAGAPSSGGLSEPAPDGAAASSAEAAKPAGSTEYTSKLLEAKERALKQRGRRTKDDEEKNE